MDLELENYKNKKVCIALSGGRDSVALLHLARARATNYNIMVLAANCNHKMREKDSDCDSEFCKELCKAWGVPLLSFVADRPLKSEAEARKWRYECLNSIIEGGAADFVFTAHHQGDVAETVLFNMSRGAALSGVCSFFGSTQKNIVRPLSQFSREQINAYIEEHALPFVDDATNFCTDFTRNKIRLEVLPRLEEAVPGAARGIARFARLASRDEELLRRLALPLITPRYLPYGLEGTPARAPHSYLIKESNEPALFTRAARMVVAEMLGKRDYTEGHLENVFALLGRGCNARFEFLGLTALREVGGVAIVPSAYLTPSPASLPFAEWYNSLSAFPACGEGAPLRGVEEVVPPTTCDQPLRFDLDKIPETAVVRYRREGDRFTPFGGKNKSLSDYLTDKKVPQAIRPRLPLVCDGSDVLMIVGLEICDQIKITPATKNRGEV